MKKAKLFLAILNSCLALTLLILVLFIQFGTPSDSDSLLSEANQSENKINTEDGEDELGKETEEDSATNQDQNDDKIVDDSNIIEENVNTKEEKEDLDGFNEDIQMVFAGDVYLSEYVTNQYNNKGIDGILSSSLQDEFKYADLSMVNQEFPFSEGGTPMKDKQFTFRIHPKYISIFKDMSIDIVSLANNHTLDYGTDGLLDSLSTLKEVDIEYVGAGANIEEAKAIREYTLKGRKIAILGASRVIPVTDWNATSSNPGLLTTYDPTALIELIKAAKENNDFAIVYVHWGIEKQNYPEEYQRTMAKQYIDAGADLVIGSHPHVLQGIEYYNGKPIVYSLGNFIFYNSIEKTALLKVTIDSLNNMKISLLPCKAENAMTSELISESSRSEFYQYITQISYGISFNDEGIVSDMQEIESTDTSEDTGSTINY